MRNIPGMKKILPGENLGIYEIVSQLGICGGMSIAYKARIIGTEHFVALKVVPAKCSDNYDVKKWERRVIALDWESNICDTLGNHPNITKYHGKGKTNDCFYVGFDFFNGRDLETIIELRETPLHKVIPVKRAVNIVKKVADGLDFIHNKGIVHKDIKCGNILVKGKNVKIIDFGLAYDLNNVDSNPKCPANIFLGTIEYAPPEYLRGTRAHPSGDIYSLGASLFHALTGETPFQHEMEGMCFLFDDADFELLASRLSSLAPHVPEDVRRVCLKALEKSPENRYQSARQFSEALNDVLKGIYSSSGTSS